MWLFFGLCLLVIVVYLLRTNSKYIKQKIFAIILSKSDFLLESLNPKKCLDPYKRQLFWKLRDMTSHDPELADEGVGCLRILEIGIGSGDNLKYYSNNTRLIGVEPNSNFESDFKKNLEDFPFIILEKLITGTAEEDMSLIKDNSIDVVVSTHVLCSVSDVRRCLKEIRRVLAPNGRFVYVEHVSYEPGSMNYRIQSWVEFVWRLFNDDCRLTLQTSQLIRSAHFSAIEEQSIVINELFVTLIRPHILGIAYK